MIPLSVNEIIAFIVPTMLILLTLYFLIYKIKDITHLARVFFKIMHHPMREKILDIMSYLTTLPPTMLSELLKKHAIVFTIYAQSLKKLIEKYTYAREEHYGVYTKASAKYNVDFIRACLGSHEDLRTLAVILSYHIIEKCKQYSRGEISRIATLAGGNIILAEEVSKYLELPMIILGDLAGKKDAIFGEYSSGEVVIIVDDIAFTGTMIIRCLETLKREGLQCTDVFVILKRSNLSDREIADYNLKNSTNIKIIAFKDLLDRDLDNIFQNKKNLKDNDFQINFKSL